jgi:mycofactocin precursor
MVSDRRSPLPSLQYSIHNSINVSLSSKLLLFGLQCQYHSECQIKPAKKGVTVNPVTEAATEDEITVDVLIEDVSIDGMCGVY